jgi:hypothetical protein
VAQTVVSQKRLLIICTGSVEPAPYVSSSDNKPRAGLEMSVLDIDLDIIRGLDDEDLTEENTTAESDVTETTHKRKGKAPVTI